MATNVAKIQAELDLDSGKFSGQITSAIGKIKGFNAAVSDSDKSLRRIEKRVTGFGASVRDSMVVLGQFRASMQTLWAGTGQWVAAIIKANAELERMQALMRGVAKGDAAQRNAQANADLAQTIKLAQTAPFSIAAIGDSMVKLRSAGLDATETMKGLSNAVAAFGGNDETLKRATIALQQMAGKGVVSMEELRQQLGEAVPTAMRLMARGLGVSMGELTKKVSLGTVEAVSAIKAMNLEMQREYAGSAANMMKTWVGMTAKLKTDWLLFAKNIGDAGLFDAAKNALAELSKTLSNPTTINSARQLGEALGNMIKTFVEGTSWIINNQQAITQWGKAIVAVVAGGYMLSMIKNMQVWQNILVGMQGSLTQTTGKTRNFMAAWSNTSNLNRAKAALGGVGGAINGLLTTLTGFGGPVGLAIVAIGALIGWLVKLQAEAKQTRRDIAAALAMKANDFLSDEQYKSVTSTLNNYTAALNKTQEARKLLNQAEKQGYTNPIVVQQLKDKLAEAASASGNTEIYDAIMLKPGDWGKRIKELEGYLVPRVNGLVTNVRRSVKNKALFEEGQFVSSNSEVMDRVINDVKGKYQSREVELEKLAQEGKWTQERIGKERDELLRQETEAQIKIYDDQLKVLQDSTVSLKGAERKKVDALIAERTRMKLEAQRLNNDILAARSGGMQFLSAPGGGAEAKAAAKKAEQQANSLAALLTTAQAKGAALEAQLNDDIPKLEAFEKMLVKGKWGKNYDEGIVGAIREVLKANDELGDSIKKNKATEKLSSDLDEMAAKAKADVVSQSLKSSGDVYSQVAAGMVGFNREVAVMRSNLDKTSMSLEDFEKKVAEIKADLVEVDMIRFRDFVTDTNMENNNATLEDRARRIAEYNEKLRQYQILRDNLVKSAGGNQGRVDEINKSIDSIIASEQNRFNHESRTSWQRWLDDYKDISTEMEDVWTGAFGGMADTMADLFVTGKLGWKDFATSVLKEITRVMTAKAVAGFVELGISMFGGSVGTNTSSSTAGSNVKANSGGFKYANGGIHTSSGTMPLHKYAKGGVANSPQMAIFGEGRMNEAYVPLPDGRSIPVTMEGGGGSGGGIQNNTSINITINQNGEVESTSDASSDAKQLGKVLEPAVRKVIQEQMRPGGILWKQNNQ